MALSALRSIGDAIGATRAFMLPVSVGRWAKLSLLAVFLGAPGTPIPANPQFLDPSFWQGPPESGGSLGRQSPGAQWSDAPTIAPFDVLDPATWPTWLVVAAIAAVLIAGLYVYLGALARFVLVECLRADAVHLRRYARPHLGATVGVVGIRLLIWLLVAPVVVGFVVAVAPVGPWTVGGWTAIGLAVGVLGVLLLGWVLDTITLQFVVPTMVAADAGVVGAWRRFLPTLRDSWREYVVFAVVRLVVGTAVGIATVIGIVVAVAVGLLVLGTVGAVVVVAAGGPGSLGTAALAILVALGVGLVAFVVAASAVIAVPFQVYLWTYALLVLGDTDADLDLIPGLRAAAREENAFDLA